MQWQESQRRFLFFVFSGVVRNRVDVHVKGLCRNLCGGSYLCPARIHNRHSMREVDVFHDTFFMSLLHYSMHISIWKKTPRRFRSIYCPTRTAPKGVSRDAFWNSRDTKGKGRSASISPLGTPLLKVRLNQRGTDDGKNFKHHAHSLRITR